MSRKFAAELVGTAILLAAIVGSGIMGERMAGGNAAVALLANSVATGAALAAIIMTFGPISGAHFNPVVTLSAAVQKGIAWSDALAYMAAQLFGALLGVAVSHATFGLPLFAASPQVRAGVPQLFSECVATFGLAAVIGGCIRRNPSATPIAVAAYITAAYWFTASTSFANPAVTLARTVTDTFTGIRPADAPGFIAAQLLGGALAALFLRWLIPPSSIGADAVAVPRRFEEKYGG